MTHDSPGGAVALLRPIDPSRDHVRGDHDADDAHSLVIYGDFLCPFCRRLRAG